MRIKLVPSSSHEKPTSKADEFDQRYSGNEKSLDIVYVSRMKGSISGTTLGKVRVRVYKMSSFRNLVGLA